MHLHILQGSCRVGKAARIIDSDAGGDSTMLSVNSGSESKSMFPSIVNSNGTELKLQKVFLCMVHIFYWIVILVFSG